MLAMGKQLQISCQSIPAHCSSGSGLTDILSDLGFGSDENQPLSLLHNMHNMQLVRVRHFHQELALTDLSLTACGHVWWQQPNFFMSVCKCSCREVVQPYSRSTVSGMSC